MGKRKISKKQLELVKSILKKNGKSRNNTIRTFMAIYGFFFLLLLGFLIFKIYVHYSYVEKLKDENCDCSDDWKRLWVQYGPLIQIGVIITLGIIQFLLFTVFKFKIHENITKCISLILPILYVVYIYGLIKIDCLCSQDWRRMFILIFSSIGIFTQVITLIYSLHL